MRKIFTGKNRDSLVAVASVALLAAIILALWALYPNEGAAPGGGDEAPGEAVAPEAAPVAPPTYRYVEVIGGCGPHFDLVPCVNVRSGPGTAYAEVEKLRNGLVLKVENETVPDEDPAAAGRRWHKVIFDGFVRYPERVAGDWYVVADPTLVRAFEDVGDQDAPVGATTTTAKRIVVDLSDEVLRAYDGDELFMEEPISAGLELTPTPRGSFSVFRKTPSRYMQGPLPGVSDQYYDLPGVPWNLYFTPGGAVIHGAYWHDSFGERWSHGCVNLSPRSAETLYRWAEVGVPVFVRD